MLEGEELVKYLNSPPLDVPPGYDPSEAFRRGIEGGDWSELETAARKACRLVIGAAKKSSSVRRWLLDTRRIGDRGWNKLMIAIGREVPSAAREMHKLGPSAPMLSWAVANAVKVISGGDKQNTGEIRNGKH